MVIKQNSDLWHSVSSLSIDKNVQAGILDFDQILFAVLTHGSCDAHNLFNSFKMLRLLQFCYDGIQFKENESNASFNTAFFLVLLI